SGRQRHAVAGGTDLPAGLLHQAILLLGFHGDDSARPLLPAYLYLQPALFHERGNVAGDVWQADGSLLLSLASASGAARVARGQVPSAPGSHGDLGTAWSGGAVGRLLRHQRASIWRRIRIRRDAIGLVDYRHRTTDHASVAKDEVRSVRLRF